MNGARLESSTVKYTLSLVSPQPDVCGSIVVKWQKESAFSVAYGGKRMPHQWVCLISVFPKKSGAVCEVALRRSLCRFGLTKRCMRRNLIARSLRPKVYRRTLLRGAEIAV